MERTLQNRAFQSFRAARGILRRLAVAFLAIAFLPQWTLAAIAPGPVISVGVYDALGYPMHIAIKSPHVRYTFEAQVDLPVGPLLTGDLYFGILAHKSDVSWSWTALDNKPALTRGMVPLIKGIDMNVPQSINPATYVEGDFAHVFNGTEQTGLYFVFVMLVIADRDPGNPQNWLGVRMEPLVVRDMPL